MNDALVALFDHHRWANRRLLAACAALDDADLASAVPGAFGAIGPTLVHLVAAEGRYLAGLGMDDPRTRAIGEDGAFPGVARLQELAAWSGDALVAFAAALEGDPPIASTWRGRRHERPASFWLTQALDHAAEHRGQVTLALTALGRTPPDLDGWAWDDERRGGA